MEVAEAVGLADGELEVDALVADGVGDALVADGVGDALEGDTDGDGDGDTDADGDDDGLEVVP